MEIIKSAKKRRWHEGTFDQTSGSRIPSRERREIYETL